MIIEHLNKKFEICPREWENQEDAQKCATSVSEYIYTWDQNRVDIIHEQLSAAQNSDDELLWGEIELMELEAELGQLSANVYAHYENRPKKGHHCEIYAR